METNIMLIKAKLENISNRINRLEDLDVDYGKNPRWIVLQLVRDKLYSRLAELEKELKDENATRNI